MSSDQAVLYNVTETQETSEFIMFHPAIHSRYFDIFRVKTWKFGHYMLHYMMPCHTLTIYLFKLKAHTSDIWPFLEEVVSLSYEWRGNKVPTLWWKFERLPCLHAKCVWNTKLTIRLQVSWLYRNNFLDSSYMNVPCSYYSLRPLYMKQIEIRKFGVLPI